MTATLLPMLATPAAPFDSEEYVFEVKWDGVRALAAVEAGAWRLWGRRGADYTPRYPELAVLRRLPAGTVVDGELVVLREGRADFPALLRRHQRPGPDPAVCRPLAVSYVLFDLLCDRGQALVQEALLRRRARLHELLARVHEPVLVYSDGVEGGGRAYCARAVAQGHEGVMAKRRASHYEPGKRSRSWRKIKPAGLLPCVVIGYAAGREGVHRLLVATVRDGVLRYAGQLRAGGDAPARAALARRLAARRRSRPVVVCPEHACWVEPELYCRVQSHGWTARGRLRDAVFRGWIEGTGGGSPGPRPGRRHAAGNEEFLGGWP
jgi:bifunctional non-homologous end joining protein LigD